MAEAAQRGAEVGANAARRVADAGAGAAGRAAKAAGDVAKRAYDAAPEIAKKAADIGIDAAKDKIGNDIAAAKAVAGAAAGVAGAAKDVAGDIASPLIDAGKKAVGVAGAVEDKLVGATDAAIERVVDVGGAAFEKASAVAGDAADAVVDGANTVGGGIANAVEMVSPAAADALRGAAQSAVGAGQAAIEGVRDGVSQIASHPVSQAVGNAARGAGEWAWRNKGDIAFALGTTALLLAIPVTGGASGAVGGAMLAGRGIVLADRLRKLGMVGRGALALGKAGATVARPAMTALKPAAGLARTAGGAFYKGRVALGNSMGTKVLANGDEVGRLVHYAAKAKGPVNTGLDITTTANFLDTGYKYANGDASAKDMAIASLFMGGVGLTRYKQFLGKRQAAAELKTARIADDELRALQQKTAAALDKTDEAARAVPGGAAAPVRSAADDLGSSLARSRDARSIAHQRVVPTAPNPNATVPRLTNSVDDIAARTTAAKRNLQTARQANPQAANSTRLREAERAIDDTARSAAVTRDRVARAAAAKRALEQDEAIAGTAAHVAGRTGTYAGIQQNTANIGDGRQDGYDAAKVARSVANLFLQRNARVHG